MYGSSAQKRGLIQGNVSGRMIWFEEEKVWNGCQCAVKEQSRRERAFGSCASIETLYKEIL